MKFLISGFYLCVFTQSLFAIDSWKFTDRVAVTANPVAGVFHHLEGAGRKHIAFSDGFVTVAWEDDHSGDPQIYITSKKDGDKQFAPIVQVSTGLEAYEPAIVALPAAQFVIAWEQDGAVVVRALHNRQLQKPVKLSTDSGSHVSLASIDGKAFVVWREQRGRSWSLWVAGLKLDAMGSISLLSKNRVERKDIDTPVLFPTLAVNQSGLMVAWEDRQSGHTRLKYSFSADEGLSFNEPQYLNEFFSNRNQYDKGNGVTRVSMAAYAEDEVIAAWMDKRRGGSGYGIFTAIGSEDAFGPNEKAHSQHGDKLPHYNPATAGNKAGDFVVAWDDYRLGSSDIWISTYNDDDEWSEDYSPITASGAGEQTHVSVTMDEKGGLHLMWVEREKTDAPTRLWYSHGKQL